MTKGIRNFAIFALALIASWIVGVSVPPTWTVEKIELDVSADEEGALFYIYRGKPTYFTAVPMDEAHLNPARVHGSSVAPPIKKEFVAEVETREGRSRTSYYQLLAKHHWGFWSLLPAVVAVLLCWLTKEPVTALLGGYPLRGARPDPLRFHRGCAGSLTGFLPAPPGFCCSICGFWADSWASGRGPVQPRLLPSS